MLTALACPPAQGSFLDPARCFLRGLRLQRVGPACPEGTSSQDGARSGTRILSTVHSKYVARSAGSK